MSRGPMQYDRRGRFIPSRVRLRAETARYRKHRRRVWAAFALGVLLTWLAVVFGAQFLATLPLGL